MDTYSNIEILFENFESLTDSQKRITQLREFILELAIRGKLGTQNANDEPASILLDKVKKEKAQLAQDSRIRAKPLEPIKKNRVNFCLPPSWVVARLGEIAQYNAETKIPAANISENDWVLDLEDIEKDTSRILQKLKFKDRLSLSTKSRFRKGDILYGKLRPYLNKVVVAEEDGYCTTEIVPIRPFFGIVPKYLMYSLKSSTFLSYVNSKTYGIKMPRLGTVDAINAIIPLPPLPEQHRIVEKVDRLMALCDNLEVQQRTEHEQRIRHGTAALTALQNAKYSEELEEWWRHIEENFDPITSSLECVISLKETIVQLAVLGKLNTQNITDEPSSAILDQIKNEFPLNYKNKPRINDVPKKFSETIPDNWELVSIEYLGEKIVDCPHSTPIFGFGNFACVDTNCINDRGIINDKLRYVDYETFNLRNRRLKPQAGDIVLAREATIGTAVVLPKFPEVCLGQRVMLIRPAKYLDGHFVRLVLSSNVVKQQYLPKLIGSTVPHLNVGDVVKLIIPLPPLAEQHRIVAKVNTLMALCDKLEAQIREREAAQERFAKATINQVINAPISTIQT